MNADNSDDTARSSASEPAPSEVAEVASIRTRTLHTDEDAAQNPQLLPAALPEVSVAHDSVVPTSRKLAPPPKPRRDSAPVSGLPSQRPPAGTDTSIDGALASSALKAPLTPTITLPVNTANDEEAWIKSAALDVVSGPSVAANAPATSAASDENENASQGALRVSASNLSSVAPMLPPARAFSAPPPVAPVSEESAFKAPGSASASPDPASVSVPLAPAPAASTPPPAVGPAPSFTTAPPPAASASSSSLPNLHRRLDSLIDRASQNPPRPVASPPRPVSSVSAQRPGSFPAPSGPPRPRTDHPPPLSTSAPPSSTAIFAMRIIAVGESQAPPVVQADHSADPTAYPAGLGTRRSSRPMLAVPASAPPVARFPSVTPGPPPDFVSAASGVSRPASGVARVAPADFDLSVTDSTVDPAQITDLGLAPVAVTEPRVAPVALTDFEIVTVVSREPEAVVARATLPEVAAVTQSVSAAAPLSLLTQAAPSFAPRLATAVSALSPPSEDVTEELSDEDVSPDSTEKKQETAASEELGRDDAISVPPEEIAPVPETETKLDAVKPPPPPKRATGAPPSVPAAEPLSSAPKAMSKAPDPLAAKAAQRAKTRQPWWEDLFNEDFTRASFRVDEEQVRRDVTFIEESLGVAAGGVVLDLGCGAGHHAVEFASRGYGVVGYDLSLYQLALAADVAQERNQKINFLQGDMREMAFEEMFDGVFCWNTTFGYFEEDKNLAVAQRVFNALRPGGMFLIDVLNRDYAAASSPQQVWYEGDSCVCMDDMSVDYISSRLRVKRSIILDDGRTKECLYSLRLYSLHELGKLLHEVGFRVTEASGHPSTPGVFFGPNSQRIIMLAQRP